MISLYFTIIGNRPVNSWTGRLNWTATYPQPPPTPTQFYPMTDRRVWRNIYSYETKELLKKGVALTTGGRRCQGSWPVAIARHVFT